MTDRKEYLKAIKEERKTTHKRVEVQFTIQEFKEFERIAKQECLHPNTLIKNMAIAYKDTKYFMPANVLESLNEVSKLIRNIADNLNQMAHSSNIFQSVDQNLVFTHLSQLDRTIKDYVKAKIK